MSRRMMFDETFGPEDLNEHGDTAGMTWLMSLAMKRKRPKAAPHGACKGEASPQREA